MPGSQAPLDYIALTRGILLHANFGTPRVTFLREISNILLEFSLCDTIGLRLDGGSIDYQWLVNYNNRDSFIFKILSDNGNHNDPSGEQSRYIFLSSQFEKIIEDMLHSRIDISSNCFTKHGSFWARNPQEIMPITRNTIHTQSHVPYNIKSLAMIPFIVNNETSGILQLLSGHEDFFTSDAIELYEAIAQTLGLAIADRRAQAALRERVKELTCLYGTAQLIEQSDRSIDDRLDDIVKLLPPSWQYPDIAVARIVVDGQAYHAGEFCHAQVIQVARIVIGGIIRGTVEVGYIDEKPEFAEGAFLSEEKSLIEAMAREIALFIERNEIHEHRSQLENQLRHVDRLSLIGHLAAGVAHEMNEPVSSILGYAQLAKKTSSIPVNVAGDLDKIIGASLHTREIIKKLLLFAHQTPPHKIPVAINTVVRDGASMLENKCIQAGINLHYDFSDNLPDILADPVQMRQVIVNLMVNAIQAMPDGGSLTIETRVEDIYVKVSVHDTGTGIDQAVISEIFNPFFTTKDIGEGTGLGLSVVHGIVTSHGGSINVDSRVDIGTKFEVLLPRSDANRKIQSDTP